MTVVNFLCTCGFSLVLESNFNNGDFNSFRVFWGHPVEMLCIQLFQLRLTRKNGKFEYERKMLARISTPIKRKNKRQGVS